MLIYIAFLCQRFFFSSLPRPFNESHLHKLGRKLSTLFTLGVWRCSIVAISYYHNFSLRAICVLNMLCSRIVRFLLRVYCLALSLTTIDSNFSHFLWLFMVTFHSFATFFSFLFHRNYNFKQKNTKKMEWNSHKLT